MADNEDKGTGSLPVIGAMRRALGAARSAVGAGSGSNTSGKDIEFITGPGGRIIAGYWVEDPLTGARVFQELDSYFPKDASGGAGGFNDLLQAASSALTGYLQAQSLADARNINAAETAMKAAQFALPEGATDFPGYGPGGIAHALAAQLGLKEFSPPKPVPTRINPAKLSQPGDIGEGARSFLDRVLAAGGARGGVKT